MSSRESVITAFVAYCLPNVHSTLVDVMRPSLGWGAIIHPLTQALPAHGAYLPVSYVERQRHASRVNLNRCIRLEVSTVVKQS